jgi:hypothetical protein
LATLVLAIALAGRPAPSSSSSLAMKATAYRVSINDVPKQFIGDREPQAQAAARQRAVNAAEATKAAKVWQFLVAAKGVQTVQFFDAVAAAQQAQAQQAQAQAAVSAAASWAAVAQCEEGGVNNPTYGYYGIKEWNGFDGYPTAGSAPQSVQLQWEETYVGAPPNESGGCHGY